MGSYVDAGNLTRVRLSVDPMVAAGGGCVEYSTSFGKATREGIVINTTRARLVEALAG